MCSLSRWPSSSLGIKNGFFAPKKPNTLKKPSPPSLRRDNDGTAEPRPNILVRGQAAAVWRRHRHVWDIQAAPEMIMRIAEINVLGIHPRLSCPRHRDRPPPPSRCQRTHELTCLGPPNCARYEAVVADRVF